MVVVDQGELAAKRSQDIQALLQKLIHTYQNRIDAITNGQCPTKFDMSIASLMDAIDPMVREDRHLTILNFVE